MKALISTTEVFTCYWISSWVRDEQTQQWVPISSEISNCQRVAEVEPDDKIFEVYHTLIWVDCPDECVADQWYYKDNQVQSKPQDVPMPATPVETLP
jgi:hypothetical protein